MYLVDTDVLSDLASERSNAGVRAWAESVSSIALSVVTVEELGYALAAGPGSKTGSWLETFLTDFSEVLPVTQAIARRASELRLHAHSRGREPTQGDMLIAATAQVHQLSLVTGRMEVFDGCGISLLDPFS